MHRLFHELIFFGIADCLGIIAICFSAAPDGDAARLTPNMMAERLRLSWRQRPLSHMNRRPEAVCSFFAEQ